MYSYIHAWIQILHLEVTVLLILSWHNCRNKQQINPKQLCFNHLTINLWSREHYVFPPQLCEYLSCVYYAYMKRTFFKERQKDIKPSSITLTNALLDYWWFLSCPIAVVSPWFCSQALLQAKPEAGSSPSHCHRHRSRTRQFKPVSAAGWQRCCQSRQITPTRQKTNPYLTHSLLIEMTHYHIFFSYMILTITAHYPWPVLNHTVYLK